MLKRKFVCTLLINVNHNKTNEILRFSGFNDLNKEDQAELKKKFGSTSVSNRLIVFDLYYNYRNQFEIISFFY